MAATMTADEAAQAAAERAVDAHRADDTAPLVDAVTTAVDALSNLQRLAADRNKTIRAAAGAVVAADQALTDTRRPPIDRFGVRAVSPNAITVIDVGRSEVVEAGDLAAIAVRCAVVGHPAGLERIRQILGATDTAVARISDSLPGLGDALQVTRDEWDAATSSERRQLAEQGRRPEPATRSAA